MSNVMKIGLLVIVLMVVLSCQPSDYTKGVPVFELVARNNSDVEISVKVESGNSKQKFGAVGEKK